MTKEPIDNIQSTIDNSRPITTQTAAAAYCGVTPRTLRNWEKDHPLKNSHGHYDLAALDTLRTNGGGEKSGGIKQQVLFADLGHKEIKSKLAQFELDLKLGKYIDAEEAGRQNISKIIEVRRALLSLPRKLSMKLENKTQQQIQAILHEEMAYCLDVFAGEKLDAAAGPAEETFEYYCLLTKGEKKAFREKIGMRNKKNERYKKRYSPRRTRRARREVNL